jgi:hypothetical protein
VAECLDYRERTGSVGVWGGTYTEHATPIPEVRDVRPRKVVPMKSKRRTAATQPPKRIAARKKII